MLVTELGIVMLVRVWQLRKASVPMVVTVLGIITLVMFKSVIMGYNSNAHMPMAVTV